MKLGMQVDLGPGHIMLDGYATWYGGRLGPGDFVLDGDPASLPQFFVISLEHARSLLVCSSSSSSTLCILFLEKKFSGLFHYTMFQKKTSTHIIGYKLRNGCLILIIFDTKIPHRIWDHMTA